MRFLLLSVCFCVATVMAASSDPAPDKTSCVVCTLLVATVERYASYKAESFEKAGSYSFVCTLACTLVCSRAGVSHIRARQPCRRVRGRARGRVCVHARVRACYRACVRAVVRAIMRV